MDANDSLKSLLVSETHNYLAGLGVDRLSDQLLDMADRLSLNSGAQ